MSLIISVSGIRGTIGGLPGKGLTPVDLVNFASAYGKFILEKTKKEVCKVVVGRDARISGEQVCEFVCNTLNAMGIDTIELGLATTPTVEMAVVAEEASGGVIITASHNPQEWNALKLLNDQGEFLSHEEGEVIKEYALQRDFHYVPVEKTGIRTVKDHYLDYHIDRILDLDAVDIHAIEKAGFSVVVDGINSVGGIAVPALLRKLGVKKIWVINEEPTGLFAHNPEPLPEHLTELSKTVISRHADLGIVVDPDVDRLAFICEDGNPFGEEYTLVAITDYILQKESGDVVSNLSSTNALGMVAGKHGVKRYTSAVGEVNVVRKMKEVNAVIGGEGNGGVIYPQLHYGRDALVGIALFLSFLAQKGGTTVSDLRKTYPDFALLKDRHPLPDDVSFDQLRSTISKLFPDAKIDETDGLYFSFADGWLHIRKSNTEPIIRIYAEAKTMDRARDIIDQVKTVIRDFGE